MTSKNIFANHVKLAIQARLLLFLIICSTNSVSLQGLHTMSGLSFHFPSFSSSLFSPVFLGSPLCWALHSATPWPPNAFHCNCAGRCYLKPRSWLGDLHIFLFTCCCLMHFLILWTLVPWLPPAVKPSSCKRSDSQCLLHGAVYSLVPYLHVSDLDS